MKKSTTPKTRTRTRSRVSRPAAKTARTITKVNTGTITDVRMLCATIALLLSTGMALIAAPVQPPVARLAVAPKCGVNSIKYSKTCGVRVYKGARVGCHDGTFVQVGQNQCSSAAVISRLGAAACKNRCAGRAPAPAPVPVPAPEPRPTVRVRVDADTPLATNLLLGSINNSVARFDLMATGNEDVQLQDLAVSFHLPVANSAGMIQNIRLYDSNGQVLGSIPGVFGGPVAGDYQSAVFHNLNLRLVRNQEQTVTVKVDLTSYENIGMSGNRFQPAILSGDYDSITAGTQVSVGGVGMNSALMLEARDINFVANRGTAPLGTFEESVNLAALLPAAGNVGVNQFVVYRTKIALSWAGDAPSGASAPNAAQTIAKVVVSNQANAGNYPTTIQSLNVSMLSTIINFSDRALTVYKDALVTSALAVTTFSSAVAPGVSSFNNSSQFSDQAFADVEISGGASKNFFFTLDTTEAASTRNLSVTIPSSFVPINTPSLAGVLWSDGVVSNILAHDNTLPLSYKTFTY